MKRSFRPIFVLVALMMCSLATTALALEGQVVYTDGDVSVRSGSEVLEATIGMPVGQGDVIQTGADGVAIISISSGTDLKLRENTTLALDSLGDQIRVSLTAGGVFSKVSKLLAGRYVVKTETAVAGVRGTEFFVAYGRKIDMRPDIWLCVNSGSVEVSILETNQSVIVEEGKGINIVGGTKLTIPRRYPWTRKLNWNTDPGKGKVIDKTNLEQAYSDLLDQDYD